MVASPQHPASAPLLTRPEPTSIPTRLHGLDTLRALAIVLVLLYHLESFLPNALHRVADMGWAGVDLFFVLSGYLIGAQLLRPFTRGRDLRIGEFYLRRAYRILPAYLTVLLLYVAVPGWRESPGLDAPWKFLTFTRNLILHFPDHAFSHAWSLCVEEHFYLVLPLLLAALMRRPSLTRSVTLIVSVVLGGIALRWWIFAHVVHAPAHIDDAGIEFMKYLYYPTYTRLDGLVFGVSLAALQLFRPAWWTRIAGRGHALLATGLGVTGAAVWAFAAQYPSPDHPLRVTFGLPLLSLGLAFLVGAALAGNGMLHRRLPGAAPLATLSFSLYLTHKAVAHVDRTLLPWMDGNTGWASAAVYAITCLAAAALLYFAVERPFMVLRDRHPGRTAQRADNRLTSHPELDPAL